MPSKINPYTGEVVLTELPYGLALSGRTNSDMTPSKTAVVCAQLAGYGDDYFNNHFYMQVLHASHELLTIDGAPAPADFAAGATLTGATSLKTCVVVAKLTSTTYIVKSRSGAFTDGEVISDGTNSVDCGAGYPTFAAAAAPQAEVRKITDYVSLTGTFTVDTFTQFVDVLDEILVVHESLISVGRNDADNVFDSSAVTKNRDGSLLERTEFIIDALAGTQFRTEQSHSGPVEENAFEMFNISLFDLDSGAIASADIDITAITQTMEKSTGGADFSSAGITQPTFVKADGRVYCSYQFLAAQWAVGDLYRLTVTGITAVVDTETVYAPTMVWSNAVLEAATLDTAQLVVGNINILYPDVDQPAAAIEFTLADANGGFITDGQITDVGQIDIYRYRKGTDAAWTLIVNAAAPAGTALGTLNYSYAFPNASWAAGDLVQVHVSSVGVTKNSKVFTVPRVTAYALVGLNQIVQDLKDGGRLDLLIDSIEADTKNLYDTSLGIAPADGSLASFIATGGTALGTRLPVNKSLYDGLSGGIDAVNRAAGKMQVKAATVDLAQAAGAYDLFTGTTQDVVVEKLAFRLPNVNVADDATITSIAIASNDATPQVMISAALGVKANLTAEAQIFWTGAVLLKAGKKIQLTIAGGAADAATVCDVVAECRAVTSGGYLA